MILPTIKIKCDNVLGYRLINLSDYIKNVDIPFDIIESEIQPVISHIARTRKAKVI